MKSESIGTGTLAVEILNVSPHGFWVLVRAREYFLDYDHFPWFRRARLDQLFRVELLHEQHLYWPELDVDLDRCFRQGGRRAAAELGRVLPGNGQVQDGGARPDRPRWPAVARTDHVQ